MYGTPRVTVNLGRRNITVKTHDDFALTHQRGAYNEVNGEIEGAGYIVETDYGTATAEMLRRGNYRLEVTTNGTGFDRSTSTEFTIGIESGKLKGTGIEVCSFSSGTIKAVVENGGFAHVRSFSSRPFDIDAGQGRVVVIGCGEQAQISVKTRTGNIVVRDVVDFANYEPIDEPIQVNIDLEDGDVYVAIQKRDGRMEVIINLGGQVATKVIEGGFTVNITEKVYNLFQANPGELINDLITREAEGTMSTEE